MMRNIDAEIAELSEHVHVAWDPDRARRAFTGLQRRRRTKKRNGALAVTAAAALALGWGLYPRKSVEHAQIPPIRAPERVITPDEKPVPHADPALRLGEHSFAELSVGAQWERKQGRALLRSGRGQFVIEEPVQIVAGSIRISTRSARFSVSVDRKEVFVRVERGQIMILDGEKRTELGAGQAHLFAPSKTVASDPQSALEQALPTASSETPVWQTLAGAGDYDRAHEALVKDPQLPMNATQLLVAADIARLSHHPTEAIEPLRSILADYASDPRAPLAAFTLGRVFLDELGQPTQAAEAFARACALAPSGPLSEDAVAREVEAWSRAGDTTRAHDRANTYLRLFPDGRRLRSVRRFGGLD